MRLLKLCTNDRRDPVAGRLVSYRELAPVIHGKPATAGFLASPEGCVMCERLTGARGLPAPSIPAAIDGGNATGRRFQPDTPAYDHDTNVIRVGYKQDTIRFSPTGLCTVRHYPTVRPRLLQVLVQFSCIDFCRCRPRFPDTRRLKCLQRLPCLRLAAQCRQQSSKTYTSLILCQSLAFTTLPKLHECLYNG